MCVPASYAPRECTCVDQMLTNSIGNLFNFLPIRHSSHMTSQKSLDNLWHKDVTKNPGTSHMPYQKSVWSWCFLAAAAVLGSIHVYFHYQSGKEFYLIPLISRFVCFLWRWWKSSWAISNPKRWCCASAALNIPANLKNSAVATGLEKISFHSNPKEM